MILVIGEILIDIFPEYQRPGGAPFNLACHLSAFGFPVIFVSRVGADDSGDNLLDAARNHGIDTHHIQRDKERPTGTAEAAVDAEGLPDFCITPNAAYDRIIFTDEIADLLKQHPRMICYGTLIQRTPEGAQTLMQVLESRPPGVKCFCDINLRKGCYSKNTVFKSLIHADILKLNEDELFILKHIFDNPHATDELFITDLMHNFFIEWVSLTRGRGGSSLITSQGERTAMSGPPGEIADTAGAGDAYAAVVAAGYLSGWSQAEILDRAATFAGAVCGVEGAIPARQDFYEDHAGWRKKAAGA